MSNVIQIEIDPDIILPASCDNMPEDLRQHLLAALTNACLRYDCKQEDLVWSVKGNPRYISVKRR